MKTASNVLPRSVLAWRVSPEATTILMAMAMAIAIAIAIATPDHRRRVPRYLALKAHGLQRLK